MKIKSICICGGGNIGHAIAAYLASKECLDVRVLTRNPSRWSSQVSVKLPDQTTRHGRLNCITSDPVEAVSGVDLVIITVPKFAILDVFESLRNALVPGQAVMAVPGGAGFDWIFGSLVKSGVTLIGLQRVPFISRTNEYGRSVNIQGLKKILKMAILPKGKIEQYGAIVSELFDVETVDLGNFLSITLNNSNPLLHPARLVSLFSGWTPGQMYPNNVMFYENWDDYASELLIKADLELQQICKLIPLGLSGVQSICQYYEVDCVRSLTQKLSSIEAFRGILSPMKNEGHGWVPDLASRYFTEDIPFGTIPIKAIAELAAIDTPVLDQFIRLGQRLSGVIYLNENKLNYNACRFLPMPQNYGLQSLSELVQYAD